jgi:hypothetical protein
MIGHQPEDSFASECGALSKIRAPIAFKNLTSAEENNETWIFQIACWEYSKEH